MADAEAGTEAGSGLSHHTGDDDDMDEWGMWISALILILCLVGLFVCLACNKPEPRWRQDRRACKEEKIPDVPMGQPVMGTAIPAPPPESVDPTQIVAVLTSSGLYPANLMASAATERVPLLQMRV